MAGWRIVLWGALVLAGAIFLYLVRGILLPFVVALILAAVLEPAVRLLRLRGLSRSLSVYLVLGVFFGVVTLGGVLAAPTVARQVTGLSTKAQELSQGLVTGGKTNESFFLRWNPVEQERATSGITGRIDALFLNYGDTMEGLGLPSSRRAFTDTYLRQNRAKIGEFVQGAFNGFFGVVTGLFSQILFVFLTPLLVLMILLDMDNLRRRTPRWIPPAIRQSTVGVMREIGEVFFKYLRGIALVVSLYGLAQTTLMLIAGVPYAILLGVLFAALYLIPYIGNVLSAVTLLCVVGFSGVQGMGPFQFGSPWTYAAIVVGLYLAIGFAFDHLIYPQMVGNSVGLNPIVSLFVILCGEALFGLPGMIIAFPFAGSVKVILDRLIRVTSASAEGLKLPVVPIRHRRSTG